MKTWNQFQEEISPKRMAELEAKGKGGAARAQVQADRQVARNIDRKPLQGEKEKARRVKQADKNKGGALAIRPKGGKIQKNKKRLALDVAKAAVRAYRNRPKSDKGGALAKTGKTSAEREGLAKRDDKGSAIVRTKKSPDRRVEPLKSSRGPYTKANASQPSVPDQPTGKPKKNLGRKLRKGLKQKAGQAARDVGALGSAVGSRVKKDVLRQARKGGGTVGASSAGKMNLKGKVIERSKRS